MPASSDVDSWPRWPGSARYKFVRHLTELGALRFVSLYEHVDTGTQVVVKSVDRLGSREDRMLQEVDVRQKLSSCQGAMQLLGAYSDANRAYLVEEWASGGDLFRYVEAQADRSGAWALNEQDAARLFAGVLKAVESLHACGVAHLDVSIENVVFREDETTAFTDFEFAVPTLAEDVCATNRIQNLSSKRAYLAPEVCDRLARVARGFNYECVDMFACGAILFMLLFGDLPPWAEGGARSPASWASMRKHGSGKLPVRDGIAEPLSNEALGLLDALLSDCPSSRPTAAAAQQHPFFEIQLASKLSLETSCSPVSEEWPTLLRGQEHHTCNKRFWR